MITNGKFTLDMSKDPALYEGVSPALRASARR